MPRQMTQPEMAAYDAQQFKLMHQRELTIRDRDARISAAHRMAGDKRFRGGWATGDAEILRYLRESDPRATALLSAISGLDLEIEALSGQVGEMEAFYRNAPWPRYFPCLNRDGHIHSSLRGCKTVYGDTDMGWATEMSGLTADQAIHEGIPGQFPGLGETLCSVCFPDAPAEWCRTRSEVTRAERDAAKAAKNAARDAALALKNLAETFRTHDGDRITTVAAAKAIVRRPAETAVELEWNKSSDAAAKWSGNEDRYAEFIARIESRLIMERADAEVIAHILVMRENALPGSGWSREDQEKSVAATAQRTRKAYFG